MKINSCKECGKNKRVILALETNTVKYVGCAADSRYRVICRHCGLWFNWLSTKEDAVELWNKHNPKNETTQ